MTRDPRGETLVLGRGGAMLLPCHGSLPNSGVPSQATVQDVYDAAHGARVVMIHPETERWLSPYEWNAVDALGDRRWRFDVDGLAGKLTVLLLSRDRDRLAGPWQGAPTADHLFRGLGAYRRTVGSPWYTSTGQTAERLILSTHPRERGGLTLDRHADVPQLLDGAQVENAWLDWRRPLHEDELRAGRYVHHYDQNAQYLAAWACDLGVGEPVHSPRTFTPKVPGYWRVPELAGLAQHPATATLPAPWLAGREWFTTPTVARAVEYLGLSPVVVDAWTWTRTSRYLNGAYELLRDARKVLVTETGDYASKLALDAVKALYRVQTGRLGMSSREDASGWRRPDWADTIRATARVNLHRRLCKLVAQPFAIATDGLLFLSDEPDPIAFAGKQGVTVGRDGQERPNLPVGDGLGEFTHKGSVELEDDELANLVSLPTASATFKFLRSGR